MIIPGAFSRVCVVISRPVDVHRLSLFHNSPKSFHSGFFMLRVSSYTPAVVLSSFFRRKTLAYNSCMCTFKPRGNARALAARINTATHRLRCCSCSRWRSLAAAPAPLHAAGALLALPPCIMTSFNTKKQHPGRHKARWGAAARSSCPVSVPLQPCFGLMLLGKCPA